jgi:2,4-dienoyl-CoA reductase-like NADH-dependent reductase (Old Yellow Enzyme family)
MEVVDAVRVTAGAERTGVRISPQNMQNDIADSDPQTLFNYVVEQLSGKDLAYLHIIEGDTSSAPVPSFDYKKLKRLFGGIVVSNNGFDKQRGDVGVTRCLLLTQSGMAASAELPASVGIGFEDERGLQVDWLSPGETCC